LSQPAISHSREDFREFYESVGNLYPEEEIVYRTLRGILRRRFVHSYLARFNGFFLDLGCNRGAYLSHYHQGKSVGVDLAHSVLRQAKQRHPAAFYVQGDAQQLGFIRSKSFDCLLCSEVIEHVTLPNRIFGEAFRILKSGGVFLLTTPNYTKKKPTWIPIGELRGFGISGVADDRYFHTAFRPEELRAMAGEAGFEIVESGTFEKEVIYASRVPVVFFHTLNLINKLILRSEAFDRLNRRMLNSGTLLFYRVAVALRLDRRLTSLVNEGVRSFVFLRKPGSAP
jgi:SAM-dependent methyltransferase